MSSSLTRSTNIKNIKNMTIKSDLQWQAEDDAITMARYQEIMSDKARLKRATAAARKEAANLTKRANAMSAAAKGGRRK